MKSLPYNAGDAVLIPGQGSKIPHAVGQLSPHATTTELAHFNYSLRAASYRAHAPWSLCATLERENLHVTTREKPVHHNEEPACHKERSHML